ncbi:MAG: hypothetical protein ACXABD_18515, partial [Candidatus Thorarchaeota archaeon]
MATHEIPILGMTLAPDTSGDVFPSILDVEMTLTNAKLQMCMVMEFPTGSDIGLETSFVVPQNYAGT